MLPRYVKNSQAALFFMLHIRGFPWQPESGPFPRPVSVVEPQSRCTRPLSQPWASTGATKDPGISLGTYRRSQSDWLWQSTLILTEAPLESEHLHLEIKVFSRLFIRIMEKGQDMMDNNERCRRSKAGQVNFTLLWLYNICIHLLFFRKYCPQHFGLVCKMQWCPNNSKLAHFLCTSTYFTSADSVHMFC